MGKLFEYSKSVCIYTSCSNTLDAMRITFTAIYRDWVHIKWKRIWKIVDVLSELFDSFRFDSIRVDGHVWCLTDWTSVFIRQKPEQCVNIVTWNSWAHKRAIDVCFAIVVQLYVLHFPLYFIFVRRVSFFILGLLCWFINAATVLRSSSLQCFIVFNLSTRFFENKTTTKKPPSNVT